MKIVSYPKEFVDTLLSKFKELIENGIVAEGRYYDEVPLEFIPGKLSIPVASGGAAILALLAYQKFVCDKTHVIIQANTMRAVYTIPKLLGMEIKVADCSHDGFLAMSTEALRKTITDGDSHDLREKTVVVYSVIGGYLAPSYLEIENICRYYGIPLIVDMAHGHYLDRIMSSNYADLAFSFYATKILPAGEGGLVSTNHSDVCDWVKRFLIYDRFRNELEVGLNMRASELTSFFIYTLMNDPSCKTFFRDDRVAIGLYYKEICIEKEIAFIDPDKAIDYNGYKFIIIDTWEAALQKRTDLTRYEPTSTVFGTDVRGGKTLLPHWCPPTYRSLYPEFFKK